MSFNFLRPGERFSDLPDPRGPGRRKFIGDCCAAVGTTGLLSAISQLRVLGAVVDGKSSTAAASGEDYRALVCIFLGGGNDTNNVIVPTDDASYSAYARARSSLALPRSSLLGITPSSGDGRTWGLHPSMGAARDLFNSGKLAFLGNVGTLCAPTTKAQWETRGVPLPPQLFSHNDQSGQWQSSIPDKPFKTGWGGRLADLTNAANSSTNISMAISMNGGSYFQVGRNVVQYVVNAGGVTLMEGRSSDLSNIQGVRTQAQDEILQATNQSLFQSAFAGITSAAISDSRLLYDILGGEPEPTTVFPSTNLAGQLKMIARLIKVRAKLGLKRQIFFASMGGWDTHANQAAGDGTSGAHSYLLWELTSALQSFYSATEELGIADKVTAFTASDFGRTFRTNGDGSDHGWGSHQMIVGGAVKGGNIYGSMQEHTLNGPDDSGGGRWIPTTSVDEYSATLARWFGVSDSDLPIVLPNIGRFARRDLGFMTL